MNRTMRAVLPLALLLFLSSAAYGQGKYALLIGVDRPRVNVEYVTPLKYPSKDVDDLAKVLEKNGYEVVSLKNGQATRRAILMYLSDLAARIQPEDSFILYYSGHGLRNARNKKTYWVTWEVDTSLIDADGIRLRHLIEYALDVPAKRKLILLDHCFSGDVGDTSSQALAGSDSAAPAPAGTAGKTTTTASGAVRKTAIAIDEFRQQVNPSVEGVVIVPASRDEALEADALKHGVYTWVLLKAMTTRDADKLEPKGQLTLAELTAYMASEVPDVVTKQSLGSMAAPTAIDNGSNLGSWVLVDLPMNQPEASTRAAELKEKLRSWFAAGFITGDTRFRCLDVIDRWVTANGLDTALTGPDVQVWRFLRSAVESAGNEERRAKTLEDDLKGVPK